MISRLWYVVALLVVVSMLAACVAPAPPAPAPAEEAPAPTEAPAEEAPAATEAPAEEAPVDVEAVQADPTNLMPNGIGELDCSGVNLVVATQTGPQIASPVQDFMAPPPIIAATCIPLRSSSAPSTVLARGHNPKGALCAGHAIGPDACR